jgi:hypothetical protein
MRKLIYTSSIAASVIIVSIISCQKENKVSNSSNNQPPHLRVYLTDAPASYDEVVVDVRDVMINLSNGSSGGWQSLSNVAARTYNLLDLVNGKDTLLADSDIPHGGTISQVRLILGPNNYVVVNGDKIQLTIPSAEQSGLKVNVNQKLDSGFLYNMVLDFDAARSIVKTGNGKYMLKPVIRASFQLGNGQIKGAVIPDSVQTAVFALRGIDTIAGTFTDSLGAYMLSLDSGIYSLHFIPGDTTFFSEQRNGINVSRGAITVVDTVHLHK